MRIYAISIAAHAPTHDADEQKPGFIYMHMPGLVQAESSEAAADLARAQAFQLWPIAEEWTGHQALIIPVTKLFYDMMLQSITMGRLDMRPEQGCLTRFSDGVNETIGIDSILRRTKDQGHNCSKVSKTKV